MEPTTMLVASAAAPVVGGLVGNLMGSSDRKRQQAMIKRAMAELEAVGSPPDLSREIIYKELQRAGILTPQLEEEIQIAESEVAKIKEDTTLRDTQKQALERIKQQSQTGLTAEDRAALNQARGEVQRDSEAKRQQIMQSMQARGMAGSGAELMSALQSSQGAADQAAAGSDAIMAQAQQRALQALSESGRMAGDIRSQDFGVESAKAQALDERNRMLAQNSVARQSANVGRLNQAQQMNLQEQQRIQDANTQMVNAERLRQNQAKGELWDRQMGLAAAKASAAAGQAANYGARAQQTGQMFSGLGSAVGQGFASYGQMQNQQSQRSLDAAKAGLVSDGKGGWITSDENKKTNIDYTDEEVTMWMDRISKLLKGKK